MQPKRGQNSNFNSDSFKPESMKKISPNDHFPCFACFDDPKEKSNCKECYGKGWVKGSHPMVQFAEDFIQKRIGGLIHSQGTNSSMPFSDFGDCMVRMSESDGPHRAHKQPFPHASTRTVQIQQQYRRYDTEQTALLQDCFCDQCITKQPIKGKRYHCRQCEDYDLCESCFMSGMHAQHQMQEMMPFRRPDSNSLVAENKRLNQLKKSGRLSNK